MTAMDQYYRAYVAYMEAVSPLRGYKSFTEALRKADAGTDTHNGNVKRREIDMDWVETIEAALPSIDLAIRENRRFITQQDEIVPIEKSRKITSESVRHLAQHTNLIAKVEGDRVTPESILNIFREESFEIYENRFLRTLLDNLMQFVERRYQALMGHTGDSVVHLEIERSIPFEQGSFQVSLNYLEKSKEQEALNMNSDVAVLGDFERVLRIRKILADFSASPLMKSLARAERVRPPITRTNVILKDPNFRAAMDLWTFIESYSKDGYRTVMEEAVGTMGPNVQQGLYDAFDFLRFSLRLRLSPPLREMLQQNYEEEERKRAAEAQRLEEERKRIEQLRIEAAVRQAVRDWEEKLKLLEEQHRAAEQALREQQERELLKQHAEFETRLAAQRSSFERRAAEERAEHEAALREEQALRERQAAEHEAALREEQALRERQAAEHEAALRGERAEHEAALQTLREQHTRELTAAQTEFDRTVKKQRDTYERELREQRELYEREYAAQQAEQAAQLQANREAQEQELAALRATHAAAISAISAQLTAAETDRALSEQKLQQLQTALENSERQLAEARESAAGLQQELRKRQTKLQLILEKAEAGYRKRLEKQEKKQQRQIAKLEKKLEKALRKCPREEVMAAGEQE